MFTFTAILVLAAPVPKMKAAGVELRDLGGELLIASADISRYDWDTHTLTVPKAVKARLVNDNPGFFAVYLDGKELYSGPFWRSRADEPCLGVLILLDDTPDDQIRIEFNHSRLDPKADTDVRQNADVRDALKKAGKLK